MIGLGHDIQLNKIYEAIEALLAQRAEINKWEDRNELDLKRERFNICAGKQSINFG